ncbi:MAG TPA: penicillin-binding transpeptidase domain-containing protein [Caulobacteraceae bacterium]|nr:penicillin-binding transpeptidase domain-containing protein [Caulobacteraceae bacterium]
MPRLLPIAVAFSLALAGCGPKAKPLSNSDALESAIDRGMGGVGTCVVLLDAKTGGTVYQYNTDQVCKYRLPPCETFNVVTGVLGLDRGIVTPTTVFKWDGSPQPVTAWQTNADLAKAWKYEIAWWFQKLAGEIGRDSFAKALAQMGYGNQNLGGATGAFWMGPQNGGKLALSTREQATFLERLYAGRFPLGHDAASTVEGLFSSDTRAGATMSGQTGSCPSQADGSRRVGWWVGRLTTPKRDIVFAASIEGPTAPPGEEVESGFKDAMSDAGLWPSD